MWRLHNMLLNNQGVTEGIKEEIKNTWRQITMKHDDPKPMDAAKAVLRGKFIAIQSYLKKQDKSESKLTPKETRERRMNKTQS